MDFDIKEVTSSLKKPQFIILGLVVAVIAFISIKGNTNNASVQVDDSDDENGGKTIVYQNEGGFTADDITNMTENSYYALAETIGTGLENLGSVIIKNQNEQFSNLQTIVTNNSNDNGIGDNNTNIVPTSTTSSTKPKTTKKYVTVKKYTGSKSSIATGTLSGIAKANKTTVAKLLKLNPSIKNKDKIYVGQKVRVK